jgi:hypothetical protein
MNVWTPSRDREHGSQPFPHIVVDDFLPGDLVERFLDSIGDDESIFDHHGWGGNRVSSRFGTKEYARFLETNDAFREIHAYLNSPDTIKSIYKWLGDDIKTSGLKPAYQKPENIRYNGEKTEFGITSSKLKKLFIKTFYNPVLRKMKLRRVVRGIARLFSRPEMYPLISFSRSKGGYVEPVHTDSRHKVFVCLIYLDTMENSGEFLIQKLKQEKPLSSCEMYPDESDVETVVALQPKRNRLAMFLNQNNAYHATNPFEGLRRFIYFAYAVSNEESAFVTDEPVLLGDIGRKGQI